MSDIDALEEIAEQLDPHQNVGTRKTCRGRSGGKGFLAGKRQPKWRQQLSTERGWDHHRRMEAAINGISVSGHPSAVIDAGAGEAVHTRGPDTVQTRSERREG